MSEAISAQGTTLEVAFSDGSPDDFSLIPEVRSIGGPSDKAEEIDVTHLGSTGGRREFIQGFKDSDDCAVEMNYVPANTIQSDFLDLYASGDKKGYKVTWPDGATLEFTAFIKGRGRPVQVGNAIVITATLRITGDIDFTPSM